jgi:hypothetical protein
MVVVPEPAVKGGGAFLAGAVDGAVGPAVDECADEALCFAVGLGSVGAGAAVADAEAAAGERVQGGDVGGAVVGQESLDSDAAAAVEGDCAAEEADRGCRLLVREHLGVGEAAVVVDADVDVFEADVVAALALEVGAGRVVPLATLASKDAFAGTALDSSQLLDVDVDELTWPRALVADRLLKPEPAQPPVDRAGSGSRRRSRAPSPASRRSPPL